jgi:integrase
MVFKMKLYSDRYKTGEKALSREEYTKLIAVIDDSQDELMIRLGVATGIRREDLCNIEITNINLRDQVLTFYESKKKRIKQIDLPDEVCVLIKKFFNGMEKKTLDKRVKLFSYTGRTAYNRFNHWCVVAGINERPIHALRATCIKFAHNAGWSDNEIAKLTGDNIATIREHYMVPSVDEMKQVTQRRAFI